MMVFSIMFPDHTEASKVLSLFWTRSNDESDALVYFGLYKQSLNGYRHECVADWLIQCIGQM